jgi:hypothetical protein
VKKKKSKSRLSNPIAVLEDRKGRSYRYPVKRGQFRTPFELEQSASDHFGQDLGYVGSENPRKKKSERRRWTKQRKQRKNPIAIYNHPSPRLRATNPKKDVKLPASNIEIRYRRTSGSYSGKMFSHKFKSGASLFGMSDGSILLKSTSGKKLWGTA